MLTFRRDTDEFINWKENQMEELSYRIRISAFWILHIVAFFAYRTMAVSVDAFNVSILDNSDFGSYIAVMMAIALLSLLLKGRTNRSFNIIAGSIVGAGQIIMFVDGMVGYPTEPFNWMTAATLVFMVAIIWLAVKLPKQTT
jgi:hypothetical protein